MRSEIITVEQGVYQNGEWKQEKLWNGDETDRGLFSTISPQWCACGWDTPSVRFRGRGEILQLDGHSKGGPWLREGRNSASYGTIWD